MIFRKFLTAAFMACFVGIAAAAGVGDSASFTINNVQVTGKVTAVAADGTLTVTSGNAVFTLKPQGDLVVMTSSAGAPVATGTYTASMNGAAMQMVGLGGAGATGLAAGGITAGTVGVVAVTVAAVAAISSDDNTAGTTGTVAP